MCFSASKIILKSVLFEYKTATFENHLENDLAHKTGRLKIAFTFISRKCGRCFVN